MRIHPLIRLSLLLTCSVSGDLAAQTVDWAARATAALAPQSGSIVLTALREPVEVVRDRWGVPHIYAKNTADLFFAQGFVAAQDRMWQLEMWRRNADGRLAEVLGPDYATRDRFARLLAFRGNWDEEFKKYHPEGRLIFDAFARGVNAAIQKALDENRVPIEFELMGFRPQPVWTAKTALSRMPGWTLTRNAASEVRRALDLKMLGVAKLQELAPTEPEKPLEMPAGLDLADIDPAILDITRNANDFGWTVRPSTSSGRREAQPSAASEETETLERADMGSNNWVIDGTKSATGMPLLANDPHREVMNPSLRYFVHLVAPGWNVFGATEPALPGVSIGHNERIAWGFTILGIDQQDLYIEETDASNPDRYRSKDQWLDMRVERQLIWIKGRSDPLEVDLKFTQHGPVLHENRSRRRAYALRWVGSEPGGAGYVPSLRVMQAASWTEFTAALAEWQIPSLSLVYADVEGNIGYVGVGRVPIRSRPLQPSFQAGKRAGVTAAEWDGLLPVPGSDGRYEWSGYQAADSNPRLFNPRQHYVHSANNHVVPRILPEYRAPLGYEYLLPYRYDRIDEVLKAPRKFSVADLERLQQDTISIPARHLMPLLRELQPESADQKRAFALLLPWDVAVDRDSTAATLFEFWLMKLEPLAYAPRLPEAARASFRRYDLGRVIQWMKTPDEAYGKDKRARLTTRDRLMLDALDQALAALRARAGDDWDRWKWGDLHTADFIHPLAGAADAGTLFAVDPVRRGGDGDTVLNTTSPSERGAKQTGGASIMFVLDVQDWDRSAGLNAPGNAAQPSHPHYKDLAAEWGEGRYFPLAFSRAKVDEVAESRLHLYPRRDTSLTSGGPSTELRAGDGGRRFEAVQTDLFSVPGAQPNLWADYDNDGDLDLYVGFRGQLARLYRNDNGTFTDVAAASGLADANDVRAAAWGDYDGDGDVDLYVGFAPGATRPNRLYRNDGKGRFVDVAREAGLRVWGATRQPSWIDVDNDGDLDLSVGFRDRPNALYRNDGGKFTDVAPAMGFADPRKTVGIVWFDFDGDGDLDAFVANQEGDANGFYRNDGSRFVDIAKELGLDMAGRPAVYGGVGPSLADFDNDGDLDLYVANYGPNQLWRNDGGTFVDVAPELGVALDFHATPSAWGDYDNDGWIDLYVGYGGPNPRDYLLHNEGVAAEASAGGEPGAAGGAPTLRHRGFTDATPAVIFKHDATHGVQWADFDADGDLDLALASNDPNGTHFLFRNQLTPERAKRSLQVVVLDERGRATRAGAEVRLYAPGSRRLLGTRIVDTGGGYCSQNVAPVHFGGIEGAVDLEVTSMSRAGRRVTRVSSVDPAAYGGRAVVVKVGGGQGSAR